MVRSQARSRGLPDVLVPQLRPRGDELRHQRHAPLVVQHRDRDAVLGQPVVPAVERLRLADDHRPDPELPHEARAVPARRERRHHDRFAVVALTTGVAERRRLGVHRRVVVLHAPVVPAAEQGAVGREQRGPDRYAALGQARPGLVQRRVQELFHTWILRRASTTYNPAARSVPTKKVMSPISGTARGTNPVNIVWLENSTTETTTPTTIAITPAGFEYERS